MIVQGVCGPWKLTLWQPVLGEDLMIALYTEDATLGPDTTEYTTENEVVGSGYNAGGKLLTGKTLSLVDGVVILDFDDPIWDPSTITARGAMIYNASRANKTIANFVFAGNIVSTNGPFTVRMPAPTPADALIRQD